MQTRNLCVLQGRPPRAFEFRRGGTRWQHRVPHGLPFPYRKLRDPERQLLKPALDGTLAHNPCPYSKVCAEREAWRLAGGQSRWGLVAINPGLVLGPSLVWLFRPISAGVRRKFVSLNVGHRVRFARARRQLSRCGGDRAGAMRSAHSRRRTFARGRLIPTPFACSADGLVRLPFLTKCTCSIVRS
jgi:hypothetical protein